jgi:diacylglycerol kinase family enzyme
MTIRKGEEWGTRITAPEVITEVGGDGAIATFGRDDIMSLFKGDLFDALGCPAIVQPGAPCTLLEIDAFQCEITLKDGAVKKDIAASCIEIGSFAPRIGRSSRYVCISNAGIVRGRNLAPRAHPNDGFLDVLEVSESISLRNRIQALKRSATGTHLPHPDISARRSVDCEFHNESGSEILRIDRSKISSWNSIRITVIPDYWKIVV